MKRHWSWIALEIALLLGISMVLATILTSCTYHPHDGMSETYKGVAACQPLCPKMK